MRISWRPPSQAGVVLVAGMIAVPGVGATHPAVRARPPAGPALTISVSDGRTAVNPGDQLTYVITVRNGGRARAPHLKVTQTLSAGLDFLSSTPRAKAERRQVTWPAAIAGGRDADLPRGRAGDADAGQGAPAGGGRVRLGPGQPQAHRLRGASRPAARRGAGAGLGVAIRPARGPARRWRTPERPWPCSPRPCSPCSPAAASACGDTLSDLVITL